MIKGIDLGNVNTKEDSGMIIPAKMSRFNNELMVETDDKSIVIDNEKIYVGIGDYETGWEKASKKLTKVSMINILARSSQEIEFDVVIGLPINQYKKDKDTLKDDLLTNNRINNVIVDGKIKRTIILNRVEVFPEGIGAYYGLSDKLKDEIGSNDIVMIDIGGGSTDISLLTIEKGKRKVIESTSKAVGMLHIYTDFINAVNSEYGLTKEIEEAEVILKNGLYVYGKKMDLKFAKDIILSYIEKIFKELNMKYPLKTSCVVLAGGGCSVMWGVFKKHIPHLMLHDNYLLANAIGFKKVGESLWQRS